MEMSLSVSCRTYNYILATDALVPVLLLNAYISFHSYPSHSNFHRPKVLLLLILHNPILDSSSKLLHQSLEVRIEGATIDGGELLLHQTSDGYQLGDDVGMGDYVVIFEYFYLTFLQFYRKNCLQIFCLIDQGKYR